MNRYDNEKIIIQDFQELRKNEIGIYPTNLKTFLILHSIHNKRKWKKWIDTSSKKDLPPDFYNEKLKLMMDVMRVDDHTHIDENGKIVNPHNKRESELLNELIEKNPSVKSAAEKGNVFITPYTGLSTDDDHNYRYYVDDFKRVVCNHIKNITNYKKNHPGFKTIFFIVDESSPYAKFLTKPTIRKVGDIFCAEPHYWWLDKNMIGCLKNSEVDYLIIMAPYKHFESLEKVEFPSAFVYDVKKIEYDKLIEYESEKMQSLEL